MKVFISNDLTELAEALWQKIFSATSHPLEKRWVIVPCEEAKLDLYLKWLKKSEVITGIKIMTYSELIRKIFPELPSRVELALRIETALDSIDAVNAYLHESSLKKLELSVELSALFLKYLQRPSQELSAWMVLDGWQQALWKKVFGSTLPTAAPKPVPKPVPGSLFFYHITYVAPYEWQALGHMEASWFLFAPSEMFTADLLSERQQQFLLRKVKEPASLRHYFEQDSLLLSNWIGYGQPLLNYFEEIEMVECFKKKGGSSALATLQREWLSLEKETAASDSSIELHSAPTLLREVEVVWELIQRLTCPPCEILVLAPDIALYAAALQWVFEQRGGPFDYSITGTQADSSLLQGLQILLSLPARRFSLDGFKKLLLCTPFLERFELTVQEGEELSAWMSELNLRYDLSGHVGSWHAALKRMIEGLVKTGVFDFSDAPLVNRWIDMTLKLEKELTPISDGEKRSGKEWARLVQQWIEVFFKSDEETDILSSLLAILRHDRVDGLFPYETIHHHLQAACASGRGCIRRSSPDAIRFTSFKAGTATSAKVIICMGMQEGAFPRPDLPSSLAELPLPSRAMEDRYLFLEAISHAEEKLIITYQRCHPDDGKEVHPSSVIQELSKDRGGLVLTHHPLRCAEMGSKATRNKGPLTCPPKKVIDIRVLRKLARHPVRCFLEEGLGLRFHPHKTEAEFLFSPLEMHHLRKKSRRIGLDELVHELGCEGKLPSGSFEAAALLSIEKEINAYQSALAELQIDPASVFSLELTPHAKTFKRVSEDLCVAPALHVGTVQLQGIIEDVSPQGLLFHGEEKIEDLLKVWPLYIIVQIVLGPSPIFFTKKAATATTTLANPHEALERYICYLHKSLQTPSPLLPAWGRRIFKGEEPPLSTEDEILLWAIERDLLPPIKEWTAEWAPYLQEVVRELV